MFMRKIILASAAFSVILFTACNSETTNNESVDTSYNADGTVTTTHSETTTTEPTTIGQDIDTAAARARATGNEARNDVKAASREAKEDIKEAAQDVKDAAKKGARKVDEKAKEVRDDLRD
jgi:hypothetical protein